MAAIALGLSEEEVVQLTLDSLGHSFLDHEYLELLHEKFKAATADLLRHWHDGQYG